MRGTRYAAAYALAIALTIAARAGFIQSAVPIVSIAAALFVSWSPDGAERISKHRFATNFICAAHIDKTHHNDYMRRAYLFRLSQERGLSEEASVRRMDRRTMELNQVSYFINLAETLNFTAAARLSGV